MFRRGQVKVQNTVRSSSGNFNKAILLGDVIIHCEQTAVYLERNSVSHVTQGGTRRKACSEDSICPTHLLQPFSHHFVVIIIGYHGGTYSPASMSVDYCLHKTGHITV